MSMSNTEKAVKDIRRKTCRKFFFEEETTGTDLFFEREAVPGFTLHSISDLD